MKWILLIVFALASEIGIAQKEVRAKDVESLVDKIVRNEYGREWAQGINKWRRSCRALEGAKSGDSIFICIDLIPWEASYREVVLIGDSAFGFTTQWDTGECSRLIDEGLRKLCNIVRKGDVEEMKKLTAGKEEGERTLDLAPTNVICARREGGTYRYESEKVYVVDCEESRK